MPLKRGKSKKAISYNIKELVETYKEKGHIGKVYPRSMAHARRIAAAIAYDKAGINKKDSRGKKRRKGRK